MLDVRLVSRTLIDQGRIWVPRAEVRNALGELIEVMELTEGYTNKFKAVTWLDDRIYEFADGRDNVYVSTKLVVIAD